MTTDFGGRTTGAASADDLAALQAEVDALETELADLEAGNSTDEEREALEVQLDTARLAVVDAQKLIDEAQDASQVIQNQRLDDLERRVPAHGYLDIDGDFSFHDYEGPHTILTLSDSLGVDTRTITYGAFNNQQTLEMEEGDIKTFAFNAVVGWKLRDNVEGTAAPTITWAVSSLKQKGKIEGDVPNSPITQFTETFTPDADGFYVLRHAADAVTGTALIYVGLSAGANDVFNSTADRIDRIDTEKFYNVELEAGVEYHFSTQAGGGSVQYSNVCFEIFAAGRDAQKEDIYIPLYHYFKENWQPSTTVTVLPYVAPEGVGVKLQDISGNNSAMIGNPFIVSEDTFNLRFEPRKEVQNKNLYVDFRRVSNNALNRLNINASTGNSTISSGSSSVHDGGDRWIVDAVFPAVAGEEYFTHLLPDFGTGQDCNVLYSWTPFATDDIRSANDATDFLRKWQRLNNTTLVPTNVDDAQLPLSRLCDETTGQWSFYSWRKDIPQRGQIQYAKVTWRTDAETPNNACLRLSLSGVVVDTLFNIATGDVVEKNGGQTEVVSTKWLDTEETIREAIIQYNVTRTDFDNWGIFPAYSANTTTGAQNGATGCWDVAIELNYDYQPESIKYISRHKVVATADNTGGQPAGNGVFQIESPDTLQTSARVTDNGDGTYEVCSNRYPVEIEADFKSTSVANAVTERVFYIRDTSTATTVRIPESIDGEFGQLNIQRPAYAIIPPNSLITIDVRSSSSSGNQVLAEGSCLTFTEIFTHTVPDSYRAVFSKEGPSGHNITSNVNGVDSVYCNLVNANDLGNGVIQLVAGTNSNYNSHANTAQTISECGDYIEVIKAGTANFHSEAMSISRANTRNAHTAQGDLFLLWTQNGYSLRSGEGDVLATGASEAGTYRFTKKIGGFVVTRDDVEIWRSPCVVDEPAPNTNLFEQFSNGWTPNGVNPTPFYNKHGAGVSLENEGTGNATLSGAFERGTEDVIHQRVELMKNTHDGNFWVDLLDGGVASGFSSRMQYNMPTNTASFTANDENHTVTMTDLGDYVVLDIGYNVATYNSTLGWRVYSMIQGTAPSLGRVDILNWERVVPTAIGNSIGPFNLAADAPAFNALLVNTQYNVVNDTPANNGSYLVTGPVNGLGTDVMRLGS